MRDHIIAIQGSVASFHDLAAKKYFGKEVYILECGTFREVCEKISQNKVDYGIIAIENKVAGSILLNYQLIEQFNLRVIGETYLPIELQLFGKQGAKLNDITEIVSHPMALGQSQLFLSNLEGVVITEYRDTSTSAKLVKDENKNGIAVIAGPAVGEKYGLEILEDNVCDVKQNYTRFYVLSKCEDYVENPDKASVMIQTFNTPGELCNALVILKKQNLNLTKIQSVPVPNDSNVYAFHLDIEFEDIVQFEKAILELTPTVKEIKVLGKYKKHVLNNDREIEINIQHNLN